MSEVEFGYRIAHQLDLGTDALPNRITERLFMARQQALGHHRRGAGLLGLPGVGHLTHDVLLPQLRILLSVIVLLASVLGVYYWNQMTQADENSEVDAALLSDDLPPDAYLDHGFDTWLKDSGSLRQQ